MAITDKQVEYVAHLSRLELSGEETSTFSRQLDEILKSIEKLNELDTEDVEPLVHMSPRSGVMRADEISESLSREEALSNAPSRKRGHFKVPSIIE
ncbi:MAG: Asp-tRNA(Asn)/Glu-tRNA(Gln) amidotransferase subunit GatC [Planctomycetota bacterium]